MSTVNYRIETIIGPRVLILDGTSFENCTLKGCTLVYEGGAPRRLRSSFTIDSPRSPLAAIRPSGPIR